MSFLSLLPLSDSSPDGTRKNHPAPSRQERGYPQASGAGSELDWALASEEGSPKAPGHLKVASLYKEDESSIMRTNHPL